MRHSVVPSRVSQSISAPYTTSSAAALSKLLEKKKEYNAVSALERASSLYLERIEALGEDCDTMANAGEVHGQVLAQWPKMFQILSQFLSSRESFEAELEDQSALQPMPEGQRLVRIPVDELQQMNEEKS
ncbi:hypothetical protein GALMADRAFT_249358 [Galerina marginata CBS 339.88]|uniref:DASH complex subunit DAD2 n=1 Tax=Galerina marginata (strain CBS 339.88) TaxID=685588 RepID=A0A067SZ15_GALM3|nr:hypothetical protein GALMADRAFT_249358 [Galerina marginata CBS 339.88]